jgi:hypothetical protein
MGVGGLNAEFDAGDICGAATVVECRSCRGSSDLKITISIKLSTGAPLDDVQIYIYIQWIND